MVRGGRSPLLLALTVIVALVLSDLFGLITLPWGVVGHEGSTLLVTLNGLRLLRRVRHTSPG
jgi:Cd2+/Zn2+-exporting ATPase